MPKPFHETIRDQWKERVLDQRQSGLSIAVWCRQNNFTPHTFYYWRDRLFPKPPIHRTDFKEISELQNTNPQDYKSGICLRYQEFCVYLDQGFDVGALKQCLKALKESLC